MPVDSEAPLSAMYSKDVSLPSNRPTVELVAEGMPGRNRMTSGESAQLAASVISTSSGRRRSFVKKFTGGSEREMSPSTVFRGTGHTEDKKERH